MQAVCDLRMADEREQEPTKWLYGQIRALSFDYMDTAPGEQRLSGAEPTVAGMREAMIAVYRAFPRWMEDPLRGLFRNLEQGRIPMVIHCAAGKDRTGIAVAILLSALCVPRDIIIDDYLLTNASVNYETFIVTHKNSRLGAGNIHHYLLALPAEVLAQIFKADADYLKASLEEIDMKYGGMDAYLATEIGIDNTARQRIADMLLI